MQRHVAAKHASSPRPAKPHKCDGCNKAFAYPYLLHTHQKICKIFRANSPRKVALVTNKSLIQIKRNYPSVTNSAFCGIMRDFAKSNPDIIFEGNLQQELQDSLNELKKLFSAEYLNVQDSKGLEFQTVLILVKDLHFIIREYVARFRLLDPRVCLGMDGGNGKFLVTLAMLDMANLGPDVCGYSRNGRRRALIIAAANRCKENKENLNKVLGRLFLVKLEYPTIFPMDLLCANLVMGLGRHTSYCPCLYCEGYKLMDDMVTPTTKKALYWYQDARRRTMRMIIELRRKFLEKWRGRTNSAAAKADLRHFASVIDWPIELPEAMLDLLVLLVIPPDQLHVCLIGPGNDIVEIVEKMMGKEEWNQHLREIKLSPSHAGAGGTYNGQDLKAIIRPDSLAKLAPKIPNGEDITDYMEAIDKLHAMCVAKSVVPYNVWGICANFRATFTKVYYLQLGLSATPKIHICWTHIPEWFELTETGKFTLYQADCSNTESCHGAVKKLEQRSNLLNRRKRGEERELRSLHTTVSSFNHHNTTLTDRAEVDTTEIAAESVHFDQDREAEANLHVPDHQGPGDVADNTTPHPGKVPGLECKEASEDPAVDSVKTPESDVSLIWKLQKLSNYHSFSRWMVSQQRLSLTTMAMWCSPLTTRDLTTVTPLSSL